MSLALWGYVPGAYTNARNRRRRAARVAAGLCQDCPSPVVPGRTRCAEHRRRKLAENRARALAARTERTLVYHCRGCGAVGHNLRTCEVSR